MKITMNWVNRNTSEDGTRVFRETSPFTSVEGLTPIATLPQGANSYIDETAVKGTLYYYRIEVFKDTDSYLGNQVAITALGYTGPGPQELSKGDYERGYFGEVTYDKLLSGDEVALKGGVTTGTSFNPLTNWLKFAHKGKILFIPKLPIRHSVTYNALYLSGVVYGVDGPGAVIPSGQTATNQKKIIEINGDQFMLRLLNGANSNPSTYTTNSGYEALTDAEGTEWNDLMPTLVNTVPTTQLWGNFLNLPDVDLFPNSAYMTLCQEAGTVANTAISRGITGYPNAIVNIPTASASASAVVGSSAARTMVWRPVLEFLP